MSALAETSGRWMRPPSSNPPSYTPVERQGTAAMNEASAVPPAGPATMPESSLTPPPEGAEPQGPTTKPKLIRQPGRPIIRVSGEPFHVEHEADVYYLVHDKWSLMGSGRSLAAAYKDLLFEASEVAPIYTATPESKLNAEGARLAKFLLRYR